MTDHDDLRAAVDVLVRQVARDRAESAYWQEREASHGDLSVVEVYLGSLADWLPEHPAPGPPSDEAATHIDPEPPGVTLRPFIDAEVAALNAEPPSEGEVTADELAEVVKGWFDRDGHGIAAAILARFDVRRRKPAHHGTALRGGDDQ